MLHNCFRKRVNCICKVCDGREEARLCIAAGTRVSCASDSATEGASIVICGSGGRRSHLSRRLASARYRNRHDIVAKGGRLIALTRGGEFSRWMSSGAPREGGAQASAQKGHCMRRQMKCSEEYVRDDSIVGVRRVISVVVLARLEACNRQ